MSLFLKKVFIIIFLVIFSDQLIKFLVIRYSSENTYINKSAAFGIFPDSNFLLTMISLIIIIFFLMLYKKNSMAIFFIIAAALSNLLDRFFRGGVVDYINLRFWPMFNIADVVICAAIFYLCIDIIRNNNLISTNKKSNLN